MIVGTVARRYAKALFDLAAEANKVDAWAQSLVSLKRAVEASPELAAVLANPVYTKEQRQGIARELARAAGLDVDPTNLLLLLADRNRLDYVAGIADTFGRLADEKLGRVRARVTTAVTLTDAEAAALSAQLAKLAAGQVLVERAVDPSLLGGVVAQVGSFVYDGSLRSQLEELRRDLKQ